MKKIIMLLMALSMVLPAAVAQNSKALSKAQKKEYKTKMKEFKKEGWTLYGSTHSLDVALLTHYNNLNKDGEEAYEIMGSCSKFKSKNVGHQTCINNAANIYASQAGRTLKGRIVSDLAGNGDDVSAEFDHFYAAYESLVQKEINGELKESFSVIKDNKDGSYEMQSFFIVSESAATRARIRAYENAVKESEAAQKYAQKVSDFVREGFEPKNEND
jgi:Ca2+-binding EF-hand superfamily protein